MADSTSLEERIRVLEETEAIKKLKAKYWRAIDTKQWDEIAETLSDDVDADLGLMKPADKQSYVEFVRDTVGDRYCIHQGHNPEIEIIGETTAQGKWELYNELIEPETKKKLVFTAFYHDEYEKEGGEWRIKKTKVLPLYMA